jgi:hypothetical protein
MNPEKSSSQLETQTIVRLSTLEKLRDQARDANRPAMVGAIESMIKSELRMLTKLRELHAPAGRVQGHAEPSPDKPSAD